MSPENSEPSRPVLFWKGLKSIVVSWMGRERANRISAPYHDWVAQRRSRRILVHLPPSDLCVNIGCGPRPLSGWINVDSARGPLVDVVWDLRKGLPFKDGSCSAIFGEHVIEHLTKTDCDRLIRECYRALQVGGVLRLSTPDAGRYLRSYAGDGQFLRTPAFETTADTPMDRINLMMRENGQHLWCYDSESLRLSLTKAGFLTVIEQPFGISLHPRMRDIDAPERAFESIYAEGQK